MIFKCPRCKELNNGYREYRAANVVYYCQECGAVMDLLEDRVNDYKEDDE